MAISHTRNRSRTLAEGYTCLEVDYIPPKSTQSDIPCHVSMQTTLETDAMVDVVTPDYHRKVKEGAIINNDCSYTRYTFASSGNGESHYNSPSWEYYLRGPVSQYRQQSVLNFWDGLSPAVEVSERRAKLEALAHLDSTPYAFGEDVLELGETARFLKRPLKEIANISKKFRAGYLLRKKRIIRQHYADAFKHRRPLDISYYRRRKLEIQKQIVKAHAQTFLQYQFALSPLVRSTHDALEAYSATPAKLPERLTARGGDTGTDEQTGDKYYAGQTYSRLHAVSEEWKASILYTVSNPVYDWRYRLGLRAKDIPTTIWQVVPLSFMVDRMVDVTSFSKGVINLAGPQVKILAASTTHKSTVTKQYRLESEVVSGAVVTSNNETVTSTDFGYDRRVWHPSFRDTIPEVKPKGLVEDFLKIAELGALIIANMKL